jgi:hypothetical protein
VSTTEQPNLTRPRNMTPGNTQDTLIDRWNRTASLPINQVYGTIGDRHKEIYLSARALLVFVFLLLVFTVAARQIVDPDFWWHLKTGQYLVENRNIPHADIFSAVFSGKEWVTHEWLSEILIYSVYRVIGFGGLIVTFALIITGGFAIAYRRIARKASHVYVSGAALLLGALASAPTWGVRPQVFSFLFASIFLSLLEDFQDNVKERSIWWLVPLMALWVNMHAGFAVGIALILLVIIGMALTGLARRESSAALWRRLRSLCLVLIACVGAVLLNPKGARMYSYPFETLKSHAMMRYIEEWRSPDFHELMFQPLALLILATLAALAISRKRIRLTELLLLVGTAWAALRSGRNVPFFVLIAMPLLAEHTWNWMRSQRCGHWFTAPEKREVGANAALKIVLNVLLLVAAPLAVAVVRVQHTVSNQAAFEAQQFPAAAVEYLRVHRPGQPLYNEYGWGGYLIWKLYPDYRVYIDGRADVYGDAFIEEFLATHDGETNWRDPLNKYGVRTVLVKPDAGLASLLRQEQGWQRVFEDSQAVVFTR